MPAPRDRLDLFAARQSACVSFAFTQILLKELLQTIRNAHLGVCVFFPQLLLAIMKSQVIFSRPVRH